MPVFVKLPLADDFAKTNGEICWGVFNVDHIAAVLKGGDLEGNAHEDECLILLSPKKGKKYDQRILACTMDEALHLINEAILNDSIHNALKQETT